MWVHLCERVLDWWFIVQTQIKKTLLLYFSFYLNFSPILWIFFGLKPHFREVDFPCYLSASEPFFMAPAFTGHESTFCIYLLSVWTVMLVYIWCAMLQKLIRFMLHAGCSEVLNFQHKLVLYLKKNLHHFPWTIISLLIAQFSNTYLALKNVDSISKEKQVQLRG